jgi:hypothetical protein
MTDYWETVYILLLVLSSAALGYVVHEIEHSKDRVLDGLWVDNENWSEVYQTAKEYDKNGDWICVNIKGMTYPKMFETIKHEIGHEIFARSCEKNLTKCLAVIESNSS